MFRALAAVLLFSSVYSQLQDQTRIPNAHGPKVVDAVVSRIRNSCLFPDFNLFLRRLAFVASHDGDNPTTFRPGYDGGIWQIDKDKFEITKTSSKLSALISKVNKEFAVNWNTVVWSQLRRPLYSGLAAALYLASLPDTVPRVTEHQASFYQKYFKSSRGASHEYLVVAQAFKQVPVIRASGIYTYRCCYGRTFQINANKETQVLITVSDGQVEIYGSLTNQMPSAAVNGFQSSASVGNSSVVLIYQKRKPVFLTIRASGSSDGCTGTFTIKVGNVEMVNPNTLVTCIENKHFQPCSVVNVYGYLFQLISPPYNFANPCVPGHAGFHRHPTDWTKFLLCAIDGAVFVFQCQPGTIFDLTTILCSTSVPTTAMPSTTTTMSHLLTNPCTQQHYNNGQFLFPFPLNPTKYIECRKWSNQGFLKDCPKGKYWNQGNLTCVFKDGVIGPTVKTTLFSNLCKNPLRNGTIMYYPHPTKGNMYIRCDQFGNAFEESCPRDRSWNQRLLMCIPNSLQHNIIG